MSDELFESYLFQLFCEGIINDLSDRAVTVAEYGLDELVPEKHIAKQEVSPVSRKVRVEYKVCPVSKH